MKQLTLPSPAKINRFLHIIGKRDDGYHLLQTLFQYIDLSDQLSFELRSDNQIVLTPESNLGITQSENLIYKAARLMQQTSQNQQGITIHWEKNIPMGSGLGGGSSNAATCLVALNLLWQLNWPKEKLLSLAVQLGADVPFFVFGHAAWAEGIGEQLQAVELTPTWILLVIPPCHVNTAKMYALPQLTRDTPRLKIGTLVQSEIDIRLQACKNDFEKVVRQCHPEVNEALTMLSNFTDARMSGSGASVFACFNDISEAQYVAKKLPDDWKKFVVQGLNKSPLYTAIEKVVSKHENLCATT